MTTRPSTSSRSQYPARAGWVSDSTAKQPSESSRKTEKGFQASEFYNFPCFSKTVPDLKQLISSDPKAEPHNKYAVLEDVLDWATNVGYPGYASAAIDETFSTWIINTMFAKAATGAETPENAMAQAETAMKAIWEKWRERGMI